MDLSKVVMLKCSRIVVVLRNLMEDDPLDMERLDENKWNSRVIRLSETLATSRSK